MDILPPIPIPGGTRWRELRLRVLPGLIFLSTCVGIVWLWQQTAPSTVLLGQVEGTSAKVSSAKTGTLMRLDVDALQPVHRGDLLGQVITTNPEVAQRSLAVIQAEIQALRVGLQPLVPRERLAISYDRLRLAALEHRVELAATRARLQLAESEWQRAQQLFRENIISQQALEEAKATQERLAAELYERSQLLGEQEQVLGAHPGPGAALDSSTQAEGHSALEAALHVQEAKLRLTEAELAPVQLRASIDGIVSVLHHVTGETVTAGEPIVTITGSNSVRIVAYLRRPFPFTPAPGDRVEVRARPPSRTIGYSTILKTGHELVPVAPALRWPGNASTPDTGMALLLSVPCDLGLLPGDVVEIRRKRP